MTREPFMFAEMEHWTGPDLMSTVMLLSEQEEIDDFMEAYAAVCDDEDHALHNVSYMLYCMKDRDPEGVREQCERFGIELADYYEPRHWFAGTSLGVKVNSE